MQRNTLRVKLLRKLQADQALAILEEQQDMVLVDGMVSDEESHVPARKKRKTRSKAMVEIHHCVFCGSTDHNTGTCPAKPKLPSRRIGRRGKIAFVQNRRLAQVVSRLKYTNVGQRTKQYDQRPKQLSRAPMRTSFLRLARASPGLLTWMNIQDGLLCGLAGQPCPNPKCSETENKGYAGEAKLGRLVTGAGPKAANNPDISVDTVFHRCGVCRARVRVNHGSRLFRTLGGGNKGVSYMTMAFWNCAVGISLSHTCQQLDLNEKTVSEWYRTARRIMAADALERQARIVFGRRGPKTTVLEADETKIRHWSEQVTEGGVTFRRHWWYVLLGVLERGNLEKFYFTPVGLVKSDGELGRIPPLSEELWAKVCAELFDADTCAMQFSVQTWHVLM